VSTLKRTPWSFARIVTGTSNVKASNIEAPGIRCDHALREGRVAVSPPPHTTRSGGIVPVPREVAELPAGGGQESAGEVHRDRPWTDAEDWREDELSGQAKGGDSVHATGITANLSVADLAEARDFYVDFLGLSVEGFDLGWVVNLQSPDGRAVVQLVTRDETAQVNSAISVHVGDEVEAAYEEAERRGFEIVHPLTTEPWGVRRFFVRAPDGNVINIVNHKDEDV
jgi:catechol 2,3-dioxygenase-like lactoylglutathione lyase family enzyme